jgi:hypothetical protein
VLTSWGAVPMVFQSSAKSVLNGSLLAIVERIYWGKPYNLWANISISCFAKMVY